MAYYFYIDKTLLPIPPSKLTIKQGGKNKIVNLINGEDINILKSPTLKEISFEFMVPNQKYPFATTSSNAQKFIDAFTKLKVNKQPFQFIVARMKPNNVPMFWTNISCSMEDFEITEDAENGFDQMIAVNLKEYKAYSTVKATIEKDSNGQEKIVSKTTTRASNRQIPQTITVGGGVGSGIGSVGSVGSGGSITIGGAADGDLWDKIKMATGDESNYQPTIDKNNIVDPNILSAGTVIKL